MIEFIFSLIISFIALILSFGSFYYLHIQGPKLEIEHFSEHLFERQLSQYEHIFSIVNHGNKTGLLRHINIESPKNQAEIKLPPSIEKFEGPDVIKTVLPLSVKPKDSMVFGLRYDLKFPKQPHWIEVIYDKAKIINVVKKNEIIWKNKLGK